MSADTGFSRVQNPTSADATQAVVVNYATDRSIASNTALAPPALRSFLAKIAYSGLVLLRVASAIKFSKRADEKSAVGYRAISKKPFTERKLKSASALRPGNPRTGRCASMQPIRVFCPPRVMTTAHSLIVIKPGTVSKR